jgi:glycosyltransferase involved in cell wall biosynthesis
VTPPSNTLLKKRIQVIESAKNAKNEIIKICYLGRLEEDKSPRKVIEIANELINNRHESGYLFTIIGDGRLKGKLEEDVAKYDLNHKVVFTGFVENPYEYLVNQDILLITSEMEGSPLSIHEALSIGVIPISTNVGGVSEIILDKENLINYDADMIEHFANRIQDLNRMGVFDKQLKLINKG